MHVKLVLSANVILKGKFSRLSKVVLLLLTIVAPHMRTLLKFSPLIGVISIVQVSVGFV